MTETLEIEAIWFKSSELTKYLDVENLQYVPKPFESNWLTLYNIDYIAYITLYIYTTLNYNVVCRPARANDDKIVKICWYEINKTAVSKSQLWHCNLLVWDTKKVKI